MAAEPKKSPRLHRKTYLVIGAFLLLGVILAFFYLNAEDSKPRPHIRIGVSPNPTWPLLYIAQGEHYYQKAGVDVTLREYTTSRAALDGLLAGDVDIAIAMDTSIARAILKDMPIVVLAQDHSSPRLTGIMARTDRGIHQPQDFVGKRIGYHDGTSAEAFLKRFLVHERISLSQVNLVPIDVTESSDALATGKVDAVAIWEPWIAKTRKKLPNSSIKVFYNEIMSETGSLVTRRDVVEKNRSGVERTLLALGMAFDLYLNDRERAFFAMQEELADKTDFTTALGIWSHLHDDFGVSNHLMWSIQQEILWRTREQNKENINPDITSYVDASLLRNVRPDLVLLY